MRLLAEIANRWRYGYPIGEGYRIAQLSRDQFRIWRDGYTVDIVAERSAGEFQRCLYTTLPNFWRPPHEGAPIQDDTKSRMLKLVRGYWEAMGKKVNER
jgi:hypothetical protein